MEDGVRICVLKRGIQPISIATSLPLSFGPPRNVALVSASMGLHVDVSCQVDHSRDRRDSVFKDD